MKLLFQGVSDDSMAPPGRRPRARAVVITPAGLQPLLSAATGRPAVVRSVSPVGGGCINSAYRLECDGADYFVKIAGGSRLGMFEAEARALAELARCPALRVPAVVWCGARDGEAVLVLEYIELAPMEADSGRRMGEALAALHDIRAPCFGWEIDNYIGATPQDNRGCDDWTAFFGERRLRPQLRLAAANGYAGALAPRGGRLLESLDRFFEGHAPAPSLLHGDLWSGNAAADTGGRPVLFDPATYYGDRETDVAMTELFGGFPGTFRDAYESAWPLDTGYPVRRSLYNLYHVLNHLNLFGAGYLGRAVDAIDRLLAQVR